MSTNYYARITPSQEAKEALKAAIDCNLYNIIEDCYKEMYGRFEYDYCDGCFKGGEVHLGKASGGWKFLWNPNWTCKLTHINPNKWELVCPYPLTKEGVKSFIDREDIDIYDEYGELQDKEEFWNMALNWCPDGKDGYSESCYDWKPDNYDRFIDAGVKLDNYHDYYSDGLRFSICTEFC